MSSNYLYLVLIPESLVASQLDPEAFGKYLSIGSTSRSRGQALYFEVDPSFSSEAFPMSLVEERNLVKPDGRPKNSLYLSAYRVLENIPASAIGDMYLATDDGRVLKLKRGEYHAEEPRLHLYQEFCPVTPGVASTLDAIEFGKLITSPGNPVHFPRLVYSELILRELANDPAKGDIGELPYSNVGHLRDSLGQLLDEPGKKNKMVYRRLHEDVFFRTIRNGFFIAEKDNVYYYPMPSREELEAGHYGWWKSAQTTHHA
jgi:hypothetical protein